MLFLRMAKVSVGGSKVGTYRCLCLNFELVLVFFFFFGEIAVSLGRLTHCN